jgi:hypothetical protein
MRSPLAYAAFALALAATPLTAKAPDTWDGLHKVESPRLDEVYLLPGADFRGYTKVMLDPAEVAFRKNWQRDQNSGERELSRRISDEDARQILTDAQAGFDRLFAQAYRDAGYQVVTAPAADALRISTAIINLDVEAPDVMAPGRSTTYSREAGEATLVLEAKDSLSGAVLGRAVDARSTGEGVSYIRNSVTNAAEFERVFARWAKIGADGLAELKDLSPVDTEGQRLAGG